jgi:hypothetical protein
MGAGVLWWKFHNCQYLLCKTVILHKYHSSSTMSFSPFWDEIRKLDPLGKLSVTYEPGSQSNIEF